MVRPVKFTLHNFHHHEFAYNLWEDTQSCQYNCFVLCIYTDTTTTATTVSISSTHVTTWTTTSSSVFVALLPEYKGYDSHYYQDNKYNQVDPPVCHVSTLVTLFSLAGSRCILGYLLDVLAILYHTIMLKL